jgi:hypothetical protein
MLAAEGALQQMVIMKLECRIHDNLCSQAAPSGLATQLTSMFVLLISLMCSKSARM